MIVCNTSSVLVCGIAHRWATLWDQADAPVGGDRTWLIIDDTALPKKGTASVGVAPQYASALGKNANCQTLVSVTLASREVPMMLGLRVPAGKLNERRGMHDQGRCNYSCMRNELAVMPS